MMTFNENSPTVLINLLLGERQIFLLLAIIVIFAFIQHLSLHNYYFTEDIT